MSPSRTDPMVARFWTRARRFPRLIGKTVNGDRIPGGPYTTAQAIGGFLTVWLLWESRSIWGTGHIIAELMVIAGLGYGVVWSLGKVPLNSRNPLILAGGLLQAVFSPRRGRAAGRGVAEREFGTGFRPLFGGRMAPVWNGPLPGRPLDPDVPAHEEYEAPDPHWTTPDPDASDSADRALTGLQRLLADAARTPDITSAEHAERAGAEPIEDWVSAGHRVRGRTGVHQRTKGDHR